MRVSILQNLTKCYVSFDFYSCFVIHLLIFLLPSPTYVISNQKKKSDEIQAQVMREIVFIYPGVVKMFGPLIFIFFTSILFV